MEDREYNWKIIFIVSLPISLIVGYVLKVSQSNILKWTAVIAGASAAGLITYAKDKKKSNVFTSSAVVLLISVIIVALQRINLI